MAVVISAELGINHNGNPETAERMIEAAARAGCGAVKVQSYRCEDFLPEGHPDWEMFHEAEIWPWLPKLAARAHNQDLLFGVTAQTPDGAQEAADAGADFLKVGSDSLLRHDIIHACLDTGLPTWVSTGMGSWDEIESVPSGALLMLCTSIYPCEVDQANLSRLAHPDYSGFSDHTRGSLAAALATTYGILMIEKHFTLDHHADGPDHWFSADPLAMNELVFAVRKAEALLGDGEQGFVEAEEAGRERWRTTAEQPLRA